ncbi:NADP-dependent oxidoreductase [Aspergillus affinis]|uniref:NADP-dependent oxidoreductase n=1 Tax=Aspergillus affinis TaxID=1070780 RepID=UPI0022FE2F9A|nr:uncharacterized protein KD926_003258 [Aspergillus affinis]KAI9035556.1 hypothetical protein KD926_003258 [Aspergillus affinis]
MQAVRVHPAPPKATPYSPSNPAPSTALHLDSDIPIPKPSQPEELLVRVKATSIVRDMLAWPETFAHEYAIPGNDVSGIVTQVFSPDSKFKPGDEIFGMADADRGATWAEYTIMKESEVTLKPTTLSFVQAAAVPLSAQTAYEALFDHAGLSRPAVQDVKARLGARGQEPEQKQQRVLITGAAGAVGAYLVQLAAAVAGVEVVAATSSNARNGEFLRTLGADETVEYGMLEQYQGAFDIIIDVVGGEVLEKCWSYVTDTGVLVSVDSASYNFVSEHEKRGLCKTGVRALFFIVKGSTEGLAYLAELVDIGAIRSFLVDTYPLAKVREAYDLANGRYVGRGKFILSV